MQTVVYSLYDSRYISNPERAILYSTCESLEEALEEQRDDFYDSVIVKETCAVKGKNLIIIDSEVLDIPKLNPIDDDNNILNFEITFTYEKEQINASCTKKFISDSCADIHVVFLFKEKLFDVLFFDFKEEKKRFVRATHPGNSKEFSKEIIQALSDSSAALT